MCRYALGAWDMFMACFHRDWLLMKRHSFTYKTRRAPKMTAMIFPLLYATKSAGSAVDDFKELSYRIFSHSSTILAPF